MTGLRKIQGDTYIPLEVVSYINRLNDDVLLEIFSLFAPVTLMTCISLLCRRWHQLAKNPQLWKKIVLQRWPELAKQGQQPTSFLNFYFAQLRTFDPYPLASFPKICTPIISGLIPQFLMHEGQVIAVAREGKLVKIDPFTGLVVREVPFKLPVTSSIVAMASFKQHISLLLHYFDQDVRPHQAIAAIHPNSGEVIYFRKIRHIAGGVTLEEEELFYRAGLSFFKFDCRSGETTELLPEKIHNGTLFRDNRVFVLSRGGIDIFSLGEQLPPHTIYTKGVLVAAGNGRVIAHSGVTLEVWDYEGKKIDVINLKPLIKKNYDFHLYDIQILKEHLLLHIHYKYYVNAAGEVVSNNYESYEISQSSLFLYSLSSLKLTRALHFPTRISPNVIVYLGRLILHERNQSNNKNLKLQIFDLTTPLTPNAILCPIL